MRNAQQWDERYAKGQVWSTEPNRFFVEALERHGLAEHGGKALDLACGEGRNAVWLASIGWQVTGVDFSSVGIDRGRQMAADAKVDVEWVVADLQQERTSSEVRDQVVSERTSSEVRDQVGWSIELGAWDLVAHVYLHWPTAERTPFLHAAIAGVAPGGAFVVVGHDRSNIEHGHGGPQDPDVLTTPDELAELCKAGGLYVVEARVVLREVTLEPGHGAPADAGAAPTKAHAIDHVVVARRHR